MLEVVIHNSHGLGRYEVERSFYNKGAWFSQTYRFIDQKSAMTTQSASTK